MGLLDFFWGPPSRDKFAKIYMDALVSAGDTRTMRYDAKEFLIEFTAHGKKSGLSNLVNFYAEYVRAPRKRRKECLSRCVRAALSHLKEMPEDFADAIPDLRPKLWTKATIEQIRLKTMLEGDSQFDLPCEAMGEHLVLILAYDLPESVRSISQDDLDDWQTTFYEAMEAAKQNLQRDNFVFAGMNESLYASSTGDTYDATRLVMLDLVRKLKVKGDVIAMVPNRDNLLITGSDDEEGLTLMLTLAEKVLEKEPRPMTATPLRLEGDEWFDWMPAPSHPLFPRFQMAELKYLYGEYAQQKSMLEAIHKKQGTDLFVASFSAMEKNGETMSFSVWGNGVEMLLPKTHKVALVRSQGEEPIFVSWEKLEAVAGEYLKATDYYPTRFHVTDFPTDEELEALREE